MIEATPMLCEAEGAASNRLSSGGIRTIGELIEAATGPEMPEPEGERVGRFRVINGGRA